MRRSIRYEQDGKQIPPEFHDGAVRMVGAASWDLDEVHCRERNGNLTQHAEHGTLEFILPEKNIVQRKLRSSHF